MSREYEQDDHATLNAPGSPWDGCPVRVIRRTVKLATGAMYEVMTLEGRGHARPSGEVLVVGDWELRKIVRVEETK